MSVEFTKARPIEAEGARIALVTCLGCGASVLLDPDDDRDMMAVHVSWHDGIDRAFRAAYDGIGA